MANSLFKKMAPFSLRLLFSVALGFVVLFSMLHVFVPRDSSVPKVPTEAAVPAVDVQPTTTKTAKGERAVVDWSLLRGLDVMTGRKTPEIDAVDHKAVQIAGFMVPLEDFQTEVTEFLLVPSPQACIHVPPPPPNQMIFVKMNAGSKTKVAWGPIWVGGELIVQNNDSPYGKVSYYIKGEFVKPFGH